MVIPNEQVETALTGLATLTLAMSPVLIQAGNYVPGIGLGLLGLGILYLKYWRREPDAIVPAASPTV